MVDSIVVIMIDYWRNKLNQVMLVDNVMDAKCILITLLKEEEKLQLSAVDMNADTVTLIYVKTVSQQSCLD